ncbi:olfactory receptor 6X1-like [Microcaecilia unicolor]|uniref:Olfactory receptor n=1 Tax=Microcaecilia unicolor TaxID=1415580 RepID=A0A6P7WH64_9AMPH|nr:olfactory receptor 6X1-like [Microcaecilia unicolor]
MATSNRTVVTEFILLGFPSLRNLSVFLFLIVLLVYTCTIAGNVTIITLIKSDPSLHTPMYFFLCNLSFLEIWYTTAIVPKMLVNFLAERKTICLPCCVTQAFFHFFLGATEFFLLAVMSFDRYLAICNPLHYTIIMSSCICIRLAFGSWLGGFLTVFIQTVLVCGLPFCGSNVINHYYCDVVPLLKLACTDTSLLEMIVLLFATVVLLSSFIFTMISYIYIISTILRIPSNEGQRKAFSTCGAHLTVVLILYGTVIFMYVRRDAPSSLNLNKVVSVLNTLVTPLLNPFIYTLRNKEVKKSFKKAVRRNLVLSKAF